MRSFGHILWQVPIVGFIAETLGYLFSMVVALVIIKALFGVLVTEYHKAVFKPSGHVLMSKPEMALRK